LVFVTKYRYRVFDGKAVASLRMIFAKVCTDFETTLVEMDGEGNHVHLLIQYPPKVSVSSLVNSLKGVSSRMLRQQRPDLRKCIGRALYGRRPTSQLLVVKLQSASSKSTLTSKRLPAKSLISRLKNVVLRSTG
jgi:Transposase IS200 like